MAPSLEVNTEQTPEPLVLLGKETPLAAKPPTQPVTATAVPVSYPLSTKPIGFVLEDHPIDVKPKLRVCHNYL